MAIISFSNIELYKNQKPVIVAFVQLSDGDYEIDDEIRLDFHFDDLDDGKEVKESRKIAVLRGRGNQWRLFKIIEFLKENNFTTICVEDAYLKGAVVIYSRDPYYEQFDVVKFNDSGENYEEPNKVPSYIRPYSYDEFQNSNEIFYTSPERNSFITLDRADRYYDDPDGLRYSFIKFNTEKDFKNIDEVINGFVAYQVVVKITTKLGSHRIDKGESFHEGVLYEGDLKISVYDEKTKQFVEWKLDNLLGVKF